MTLSTCLINDCLRATEKFCHWQIYQREKKQWKPTKWMFSIEEIFLVKTYSQSIYLKDLYKYLQFSVLLRNESGKMGFHISFSHQWNIRSVFYVTVRPAFSSKHRTRLAIEFVYLVCTSARDQSASFHLHFGFWRSQFQVLLYSMQ